MWFCTFIPTNNVRLYIIVDCPMDFVKVPELQSCYKVFSGDVLAKSVEESQSYCSSLHSLATLTNIESDEERTYLKDIMRREGSELHNCFNPKTLRLLSMDTH